MAELPTLEEFAKQAAEKALDEIEYKGRTIREWADLIVSGDVVERKRGKWIKHNATHVQKGGMYLECSCCHEYTTVLGHVLDYCPNCGADMRPTQPNDYNALDALDREAEP